MRCLESVSKKHANLQAKALGYHVIERTVRRCITATSYTNMLSAGLQVKQITELLRRRPPEWFLCAPMTDSSIQRTILTVGKKKYPVVPFFSLPGAFLMDVPRGCEAHYLRCTSPSGIGLLHFCQGNLVRDTVASVSSVYVGIPSPSYQHDEEITVVCAM